MQNRINVMPKVLINYTLLYIEKLLSLKIKNDILSNIWNEKIFSILILLSFHGYLLKRYFDFQILKSSILFK
jgi:hypothetical protein